MEAEKWSPEWKRQQVELGATWLDRTVPDWPSRIDLGRFDLMDQDWCILGQCFKSDGEGCETGYVRGLAMMAGTTVRGPSVHDIETNRELIGSRLGIFSPIFASETYFRDAWIAAIAERLSSQELRPLQPKGEVEHIEP